MPLAKSSDLFRLFVGRFSRPGEIGGIGLNFLANFLCMDVVGAAISMAMIAMLETLPANPFGGSRQGQGARAARSLSLGEIRLSTSLTMTSASVGLISAG